MEDVRNKILEAAKKLFLEQGYKKTTIRQIVDESGVLIGSIYHFYKNKESLFRSLFFEIINIADQSIAEEYGDDIDPVFQYSALFALGLTAVEMDDIICELFYESYSFEGILDSWVEYFRKKKQNLFAYRNPQLTIEDYYVKILASTGLMHGMVTARYMKKNIPLWVRLELFLDCTLPMCGITSQEIQQVKGRLADFQSQLQIMAECLKTGNIFQ